METKQRNVHGRSFLLGILGISLFFFIAWGFCEYGTGYNPYLDDIQNLYVRQSSSAGYLADQMIAGIFLPVFLCSLVYIKKEYTVYYIVRCESRDRIWCSESLGIVFWAFIYSFLYVLVDQILLFTRVSPKTIWESKILIYLSKYGLILFLFFIMVGIAFQCIKCVVKKVWYSVGITILLMLSVYFAARADVVKIWTPFECLHFIDKEVYQLHSSVSALFDYGLILCFDVLLFWIGCCLHHKREYL